MNNPVPEELKKWNWGAFSLNVIWGIGNKAYLPLLCLIPIFGLIWVFVCGVKGNEWAWQSGDYTDLESFQKVQATWNRAGWIMFLIWIGIILLYIALFVLLMSFAFNNYPDPYRY